MSAEDSGHYSTESQAGLSASLFSFDDFAKKSRPAINESGVKLNELCAGLKFLHRRFCVENSTGSDHRNTGLPNNLAQQRCRFFTQRRSAQAALFIQRRRN